MWAQQVAKRNGLGWLEPRLDPMGKEAAQSTWTFPVSRGISFLTRQPPLRAVSGQAISTAGSWRRGGSPAEPPAVLKLSYAVVALME